MKHTKYCVFGGVMDKALDLIILHVCNLGFESRQEHIGLRISNNKQLEGSISLKCCSLDNQRVAYPLISSL